MPKRLRTPKTVAVRTSLRVTKRLRSTTGMLEVYYDQQLYIQRDEVTDPLPMETAMSAWMATNALRYAETAASI